MRPANERDDRQSVAQESRRAPRARTFLGGKIVFRDGSFSFNCTVRDISDGGARIQIAPEQLVPKWFYLLTSRDDYALEAQVEWQRGVLLGLRVLKKFNLSDSGLVFLKNLSAELRPRP